MMRRSLLLRPVEHSSFILLLSHQRKSSLLSRCVSILLMSGVCLPFISPVCLDLQLELFHNRTLLSADSPPVFPALVVLVGLLSFALHTCAPPRFLYLYFLLTQQLCSSLPLSDYPCLFICLPFLPHEPPGQSSVCLSLDFFFFLLLLLLSKSVTTFSVRLPDPWKSIKGRQREELIPNPVSK